MTIYQSDIELYSGLSPLKKSLQEARRAGKPTAFLSHSHRDSVLASGVQGFLQAKGWEVYIDWQDGEMPSSPDQETARRIQEKIREQALFLFLATANSSNSKWCPWEIGYADGVKPSESILILPTVDRSGRSYGTEYLQLYRHIDLASGGGLGHFNSAGKGYALQGTNKP